MSEPLSKIMRNRRQRGYATERTLVNTLKTKGYKAVRTPVSNTSRNPLPDVFASKNNDVYAFEVKSAKHYTYTPKNQILKLFKFLEMIPIQQHHKHAILVGHFGKKWIFKEIPKLPTEPNMRIAKRDISTWKP